MPRTGGGIYTKPFPDVTSGTTIASAVHNGIVADVETDLNAARPIIAGGTGAVNAVGARANLQVERATQVVTNFDSHVWEAGSFVAYTGATGGPPTPGGDTTTQHYYGIIYTDGINTTIEARGINDGLVYVRKKLSGAWGAWALDGGDKLSNTGGTITGNLQINGTLGVTGTTTLGTLNAGAGTFTTLTVTPGLTSINALSTSSINTNGNTITAGVINTTGINATGDIHTYRAGATDTGVIYLNSANSRYLFYNGTTYELPNAGLNVGGMVTAPYITATSHDGLQVTVPAGGSAARVSSTVSGVRTWTAGVNSAGQYVIADESAPATRFTIGTDGVATFNGNAVHAGAFHAANFYGTLNGSITGNANYANSAGYATSAGSAPASGGTASAANSVVTNSGSRTFSIYGYGTHLLIDDSSASLRAAEFTAYGDPNPSAIDLYMPYHTQTTNGVNGTWTNNFMCQFVSSGRYKTGIQDLSHEDADKILAFRPVTFRSKCPIDDPDQIKIGLIAEEVEDIEPRLVQYDYTPDAYENVRGKEGEPIRHNLRKDAKKQVMGLDYNAIVVLLLRKVQEQEERIARLEAKLSQ
jgi:hypothetical protein